MKLVHKSHVAISPKKQDGVFSTDSGIPVSGSGTIVFVGNDVQSDLIGESVYYAAGMSSYISQLDLIVTDISNVLMIEGDNNK